MLRMFHYRRIVNARKDGLSIREISRNFRHSRRKVREVLNNPEPGLYIRRTTAEQSRISNYVVEMQNILENAFTMRHPISMAAVFRRLRSSSDYTGSYSQLVRHFRQHHYPVPAEQDRSSGVPITNVPPGEVQTTSRRDWLCDHLLRNHRIGQAHKPEQFSDDEYGRLLQLMAGVGSSARRRAAVVLLRASNVSIRETARLLRCSRTTVRKTWRAYCDTGILGIRSTRQKPERKSNDKKLRSALFALLHSPPSDHDINRTTWRQGDLQRVLREQGHSACIHVIREIVKSAGYQWRKARKVLTSRDPNYREKLIRITSILERLQQDERFFSIDEFGPFHITKRGGRKLVAPDDTYTIPQSQKSRGTLIVTAALELCTNQVTHFFSDRKNTQEMIRLVDILREQYSGMQTLYFTWDAASWHMSKRLYEKIERVNKSNDTDDSPPRIVLVPLPAGSQFLNVIESVFSGMAKAIIHNSDYPSDVEAKVAIDRYFSERNDNFLANPRRAGKKIWGKEQVPPNFSESNNCKDPRWR